MSDPSTTNLMALAKLFGMTPEELLREMEEAGESFRILSHSERPKREGCDPPLGNTLRVWAIIKCAFAAKRQRGGGLWPLRLSKTMLQVSMSEQRGA